MSLDVYLYLENSVGISGSGIFVREDGQNVELTREEWDARFPGREPVVAVRDQEDECVYHANITHNLGAMAAKCGLYRCLWRPHEDGLTTAQQLIPLLQTGLQRLEAAPTVYAQYNPPNGWGTYDGLVTFVCRYLAACQAYPEATVSVSR